MIHVECLPDETLMKCLGFGKKEIMHHYGKSRVLTALSKKENQIAVVDEDPGQAQHPYFRNFKFKQAQKGLTEYLDNKNNKLIELKIKLEDWIITDCRNTSIELKKFGLPDKPNDLHDVINNRIQAFQDLIEALLKDKKSAVSALKKCLS